MPFHARNNPSEGIFQAAAALGAVGSPGGNLRVATSGQTAAGTDAFQLQPSEHDYGRDTLSRTQDAPAPTAASAAQHKMYNSPDNYAAQNMAPQLPIPTALQPPQRPGPSSAYTSPSIVPTQNNAQYQLPTRSNTVHQSQPSHSYSRSSPTAGMAEQKYIPYSNTPEQKRYYSSNSPLGLADIRPRANSTMEQEGGISHGNAMIAEQNKTASNSNYLAPWSIYAYDWCKWAVPGGSSAGKMAVGSYLEDNHNFVSP